MFVRNKILKLTIQIDKLSAEVKDSNPYSRLMALQRMGIVKNYEDIRAKTVIVVGVGGVGSDWCFMRLRYIFAFLLILK